MKNYPESQNIVMKICNGIKSYDLGDGDNDARKKLLSRMRRQKLRRKQNRRPKSSLDKQTSASINANINEITAPSAMHTSSSFPSAQNQLASEIRERVSANLNRLNFPAEFPANYFESRKRSVHYWDRTANQNNYMDECDFEYGEIISEEFRRVFDKYDATLTADQFIKQELPPPQYYLPKIQTKLLAGRQQSETAETTKEPNVVNNSNSNNQEDSGIYMASSGHFQSRPKSTAIVNPQSKFEMYHILKRMMVKKKYVLATVKLEKEANTKKPRLKRASTNINSQSNSLKTRPTTAATSISMLESNPCFKVNMFLSK